MAKKKPTKKPRAAAASAATPSASDQLRAARKHMRDLRELQRVQGQIRRRLIAANDDSVVTARALLAGTWYRVEWEKHIDELVTACDIAQRRLEQLEGELLEAKRQLNPETV